MATFPYSLQYIQCEDVVGNANVVAFTASKSFILLDSLIVKGYATSPLNNMLLSLRANSIFPMLNFVDISDFASNAGTYQYTRFARLSDTEADAQNKPFERQFVVVLLKNF